MEQIIYINHNGKKIPIIISECSEKEYRTEGGIHIFCQQANLDQDCMIQDLGGILKIIPDLIEQQKNLKKSDFIRFRLSSQEKEKIYKIAKEKGFPTLSSYLRSIAINQ